MNPKHRTKTSFEERMCEIFHRWMEEDRNGEPGDLSECYEFAKRNKLYEAPKMSERTIFKREMSRAISRERMTDADGNPIRRNHVFRVSTDDGQGYLWGELMKMKPAHVNMSFKQRLHGLGNRAVQLDRDKTYYNDNNTDGGRIDLDYDLNLFVQNAQNPVEYPEERPEGEE